MWLKYKALSFSGKRKYSGNCVYRPSVFRNGVYIDILFHSQQGSIKRRYETELLSGHYFYQILARSSIETCPSSNPSIYYHQFIMTGLINLSYPRKNVRSIVSSYYSFSKMRPVKKKTKNNHLYPVGTWRLRVYNVVFTSTQRHVTSCRVYKVVMLHRR